MKSLNYGTDYQYPHDYPQHFVPQQYLPETIQDTQFWQAADNAAEVRHQSWLSQLWHREE